MKKIRLTKQIKEKAINIMESYGYENIHFNTTNNIEYQQLEKFEKTGVFDFSYIVFNNSLKRFELKITQWLTCQGIEKLEQELIIKKELLEKLNNLLEDK